MAKGVNGIIILLPILGECWLRTIPKALPWADLFWPFFLHFVLKASKLERRPCYPFVQADMLSACMEYQDILSAITYGVSVWREITYTAATNKH